MIEVSELTIYPIKSCAGISLQSASTTSRGFEFDRYWLITQPDGNFLTQRDFPQMVHIQTRVENNRLYFSAPDMPEMSVYAKFVGTELEVRVWKSTGIETYDYGENAAQWLSTFLGIDARLVRMKDTYQRRVNPEYAMQETDQVGFADGYPFLLTTQASLDDLNGRLDQPVPMNRFRPNIVVTGNEPFEEDTWRRIKVGEVIFEVVKPCARCVVTTTDQTTGERSKEPLKTLAAYRDNDNGVMFGQNMIHHHLGKVKIGDNVKILEYR